MASIAIEDFELLDDPKNRSYISAVDKVLKNFESTSEWADLISALGKLNKVLISHIKQPVIPRRIIISKRLAQCMHPALPGGVHLKALETYDIIFKCIGTSRLGQELFIFSAGIFPLLSYAAMNVRRSLLTLYETHFLPLESKLRPGLPGFLTGVLPGLEEGNEYYDRTNSLLEKVCEGVGSKYFYGCLWETVLTNKNIRLPAVTYIYSHFNRKINMEDQLFIMGTNVDIMIEAACSAVQDISVLVQRITLDFLIAAFPMHSTNIILLDMQRLLTSSVSVVLRRDMSLNRRLYTWLLGGDSSSSVESTKESPKKSLENTNSNPEPDLRYFDNYSRPVLIKALCSCLMNKRLMAVNDHGLPQLRPYRLLITILDKPEIGGSILDEILLEIFRALYWDCNNVNEEKEVSRKKPDEKNQGELLKTANLLFGTFEPSYLWEFLGKEFFTACQMKDSIDKAAVQQVGSGSPSVTELCILTEFLLDFVSVETYVEMQTEHLPRLLKSIFKMLTINCEVISINEVTCCLKLCSRLLGKVQPILMPSKNVENLSQHQIDQSTLQNCSSDSSIGKETFANSTSNSEDVDANSLCKSWIKLCVTAFQACFVKLVSTHLFEPGLDSQGLLQNLLIDFKDINKDRLENVENMLHRVINSRFTTANTREKYVGDRPTLLPDLEVILMLGSSEFIEAFSLACHILVEFSSFPAYFPSLPTYLNQVGTKNMDEDFHIPEWLRLLLVISCFVRQMNFQLVAISAILELMALTQTAFNASLEFNEPEKISGTVSVLIEPVLEVVHLNFLHHHTMFSPIVANILWGYLDKSHVSCLPRCVELLHQLHNLAVDGNIVEDVIGKSLAEDDEKMQVRSVQKFSMLWHLSRSLPPRTSPSGKIRLLDRSLLIMLSSLLKPFEPQRAEVTTWLNHSLQRGDIGIILEPLLLILLHSDTARISVQHVSIQKSNQINPTNELVTDWEHIESKSQKDYESKIYAISSVEGHVIYHVSNRVSDKTGQGDGGSSRQIFAVSSLTGNKGGQIITANAPLKDFELPSSCDRSVQEPISMFVNPFGLNSFEKTSSSSSSLENGCAVANPTNLQRAHRIDVAALRMSSSFDDIDANSLSLSDEYSDKLLPDKESPLDSTEMVNNILLEIVDNAVALSEDANTDQLKTTSTDSVDDVQPADQENLPDVIIHPLHNYLLLYTQCYDSGRVLYALSILKGIVQTNPRLVICTMATNSIGSNPRSLRQNQLYELLARHRKVIFGKHFFGPLAPEATTAYRSSMFLEIVMSLCLYYTRSFYPNLTHIRLTEGDLVNNWEVQLQAVELLCIILAEVAAVVKDSGKGFASYVTNLLEKCKVQKTILHCVLSGVFLLSKQKSSAETFSESIIRFNEACRPHKSANVTNEEQKWDYQETFQMNMLRLLLVLIILENQLLKHSSENDEILEAKVTSEKTSNQTTNIRYQPGVPIPSQPLFQNAVLKALKQPYTKSLHRHWLSLLSCSLPFLRKSTATIVTMVVSQLCSNLEDLAALYEDGSKISPKIASFYESQVTGHKVPVDHVILQLEGLMTLTHYCLLENNNLVSTVLTYPMPNVAQTSNFPNASQIIGNLINVFTPTLVQKEGFSDSSNGSKEVNHLLIARHTLLGHLPSLVSSLSTLWQAVSYSEMRNVPQSAWIMGTPKVIKQIILEMLSPISHHHGVNFLTAVAVAWSDRKSIQSNSRLIFPVSSPEQTVLVELVRAIKVIPLDTLVKLSRQVLKQQPVIVHLKSKLNVDVIMLQFFYSYVQNTPGAILLEAWSSFQGLLKDGLQMSTLTPPCLFLLLGILNEFIQRAPPFEDRKDRKELQELTQRLVEACGNIAAASLEQTTWLRRNLAVKPGPQADVDTSLDHSDADLSTTENIPSASPKRPTTLISSISMSNYSVQALFVMAEVLSPLLDVVFLSDEKERVIPLLSNLMYNITPYLRNHSTHNAPSFRACSQLIANLSGYSYTRKAWRKDVFDLLMDGSFFMMKASCLQWWRAIIDNLMTHDRTTFTDLMVRVSLIQSGGINIFSSRELEYEQRAQLLKRLSFVIFCSDMDQYQGFMPDIQERLSESMRLIQVPNVLTQVFLCFRVLLLRMSPQHITSLWPVIITEMVQVFMQIEQELCRNSEEFNSHLRRLSNLDSSWSVSSSNGLNAHSHPAWLQLYLAVCKLLDLALCLPAELLPQFQIYSWAFVGKVDGLNYGNFENNNQSKIIKSSLKSEEQGKSEFTPHIVRLARLIKKDDASSSKGETIRATSSPLLKMRQIASLNDLHEFFEAVASTPSQHFSSSSSVSYSNEKSSERDANSRIKKAVEKLIELDFLEPLLNSN